MFNTSMMSYATFTRSDGRKRKYRYGAIAYGMVLELIKS